MDKCGHGKNPSTCKQCNRRVVGSITTYVEPKKIFELIRSKTWGYAPSELKPYYECRDRALMGAAFVCVGRITAIVGGPRYILWNKCHKCEGLVHKIRVNDTLRWICDVCDADYGAKKPEDLGKIRVIEEYPGLLRGNLEIKDDYIWVTEMKVVKRSQKLIEKRGEPVTMREPFLFPLEKGLYREEHGGAYGDQLVPFSWLLLEFLEKFKPKAKLFGIKRGRAWQIVNEVTGMFPNWFRAQAEHFFGHYIMRDSVQLSKYVGVVNPDQVGHYIGFSYESLLKDKERHMDFDWIDPAIEEIKSRLA